MVDEFDGNVTVSGEVNKEHESRYFIKVRAGDINCGIKLNEPDIGEGGKPIPRNFTYTTVWIDVIDVNDNAPVFLNGKEKILYQDIQTTQIIRLNATDKDEDAGGEVMLCFSF
jgi:hypothetical protein